MELEKTKDEKVPQEEEWGEDGTMGSGS